MRKIRRVLFIKCARLFRGEKNVVPCIISSGTKIIGNIVDGDIIEIEYHNRTVKVKILIIPQNNVSIQESSTLYEVIED